MNIISPEIASQFFVMGFVAGVIAVIFKLNGMGINEMASAFQSGVADLAGTAVVVGMAKGILLVLGGSDATVASSLNTILYGMGAAIGGLPVAVTAWLMYVFTKLVQPCCNFQFRSGSFDYADHGSSRRYRWSFKTDRSFSLSVGIGIC